MNYLPAIALIGFGLAVGWMLPQPSSRDARIMAEEKESERHRQPRQGAAQGFFISLMSEYEQEKYQFRQASTAEELVGLFKKNKSYSDGDIEHVIDCDPVGAMDLMLGDPSVSYDKCLEVAKAWARRNPGEAVRFFHDKNEYRPESCLAEILPFAVHSHLDLVADVIRSKSSAWKDRYLKNLVADFYEVRKQGAPPPVESDDPFATDEYVVTKKVGEELLKIIDDQELRERIIEVLNQPSEEKVVEKSQPSQKTEPFDVATYDGDDQDQVELFRKRSKENRDELFAEIIERGNFESRKRALSHFIGDFKMDEETWPGALKELEVWIQKLEVIPSQMPSHFDIGPNLYGKLPAQWIARQPLALQREWTPTFVETWAQREPLEAVTWAMSQPEAARRDEAFQTGIIVWAHSEPEKAASFVEDLPSGDLRDSAISNAAAAWSRVDRAGASAWLESFPDSEVKTRALKRVHGKYAACWSGLKPPERVFSPKESRENDGFGATLLNREKFQLFPEVEEPVASSPSADTENSFSL